MVATSRGGVPLARSFVAAASFSAVKSFGRPLTLPRHFRRNVSRLIELTGPDAPAVTGRIIRADEAGFTLELTGAKGATTEQTYSYDDGMRGCVQVEFNRSSDSEGDDH